MHVHSRLDEDGGQFCTQQTKFTTLYAFFWVIPLRLDFICQRFGTLCLFHPHRREGMKKYLPAYKDGIDRVFRNVGI